VVTERCVRLDLHIEVISRSDSSAKCERGDNGELHLEDSVRF